MEVGEKIRSLRAELGITQEALAERVYVTRQTISNWENGKTFPDIESLLLLSDVFGVPVDAIVKGGMSAMEERASQEQARRFREDSATYGVMLAVSVAALAASVATLNLLAGAVSAAMYGVSLFFAFRLERQKRDFDVQSFREIVAFMRGEGVEEIRAARKTGPRWPVVLAKVTAGALFGALTVFIICLVAKLL